MPAPAAVLDLVEKYRANPAQFRAQNFNETDLRITFLDPFFAALGWDVNAKDGSKSVDLRDVSHGTGTTVTDEEGKTRTVMPDYTFRIGEVSAEPAFGSA